MRLYDLLCAISVLTQHAPNHVRRVAAVPTWSVFLQILEDAGRPWLVAALHGSSAANIRSSLSTIRGGTFQLEGSTRCVQVVSLHAGSVDLPDTSPEIALPRGRQLISHRQPRLIRSRRTSDKRRHSLGPDGGAVFDQSAFDCRWRST